ncbi:MAG: hypothetical protein KBG30_09895 [Bacteroidales bacterium]|nr:hypothetical protein [Bacteroidales bacterium]
MAIKIIDPFTNIELAQMPTADSSNDPVFLSNLQAINVGQGGTNTFRVDKTGIWLGAEKYADAPFRVSMAGAVFASSLTTTGYIAVGGAAADVNAGTVTISGGKITAFSITAAQIATGTITADKLSASYIVVGGAASDVNAGSTTINGGKITANSISADKIVTGALVVGTNVGLGTAQDATGVTKIIGNTVTTSYVNALNITTASLDASSIKSGTITIGGSSQPSNLTIIESTAGYAGSTTSLLNWKSTGGTLRGKIWTDSSGYMGYNAIGGRHYFYTNNNEYAIFQDGKQAIFKKGISCRDSFNVGVPDDTVVNARITGLLYLNPTSNNSAQINGGTTTWSGTTYYNSLSYNAKEAHCFFINDSHAVKITPSGVTTSGYFYNAGQNYMWFKDYKLTLTSDKTAIIPTSRGFNALYSVEAPEVWFVDFCKRKKELDPLFKEVTVPPYHFIKCEGGEYQVWGKRKGHEYKRFETKTQAEFEANEKFLNMNKPRRRSVVKRSI